MALPAAPLTTDNESLLYLIKDAGAGSYQANILRARFAAALSGADGFDADLAVLPMSGTLENGNRQLTASTALQLSTTSQPCNGVLVKARPANAATIYVGKSDVTAGTTEATGGWPLEPGESVGVPCRDLNEVYIRGTSGDGIAWMASIVA